ncbi:MAG: hypothetical protein IPJ65_13645 [Archangiaceae bacterium]|nr:hypothetical protein [Archangiaceae bacterium]
MLLDGNRRGSTPGRDRVVGTRETTRCSACTDALEVPPATEDSTAGTVDPTISIETMRFHPLGELACIQLARLFHLHQASPVRSGPPLLVSRTTAVPRVEVRRRSRRAEHARFLDLVLSLLGASRASAVVPPDNYLGPWIPLLVLEVDPSTAARDIAAPPPSTSRREPRRYPRRKRTASRVDRLAKFQFDFFFELVSFAFLFGVSELHDQIFEVALEPISQRLLDPLFASFAR